MYELIIISLLISIMVVLILRDAPSEILEGVALISGMILFFIFITIIMLLPEPNIMQIMYYARTDVKQLEQIGFWGLMNAVSPMYTIMVALGIFGYAYSKHSERIEKLEIGD